MGNVQSNDRKAMIWSFLCWPFGPVDYGLGHGRKWKTHWESLFLFGYFNAWFLSLPGSWIISDARAAEWKQKWRQWCVPLRLWSRMHYFLAIEWRWVDTTRRWSRWPINTNNMIPKPPNLYSLGFLWGQIIFTSRRPTRDRSPTCFHKIFGWSFLLRSAHCCWAVHLQFQCVKPGKAACLQDCTGESLHDAMKTWHGCLVTPRCTKK